MEFVRLFTAIKPPQETITVLVEMQNALRDEVESSAVRWTGKENLHLTLQFLGDTPTDRVPDLIDAMTAGVAHAGLSEDLEVRVSGVGAFPGISRPRVVWAGLREETGSLSRLEREVRTQLSDRGFAVDSKPFRPHITLGYVRRRATRQSLDALSAALRSTDATGVSHAGFPVNTLVLVQSTLTNSGAIYSDIHSVRLSEARSSTSSGESARE